MPSGYSGREIDSLARALPIADLFRTYQPRAPRSLGLLRPLVVLEQGTGRFILQTATIREPEVNALVNSAMLRANLVARGTLTRFLFHSALSQPIWRNRASVVLASEDLAQADRASFALPLIFSPESLNRRLLADGGLAANFPIAVARNSGAQRVIAYDNELGGRMWAGAVDRRLLNLALEGSTALLLGDLRQELYLGFRRNYQLGR